MNNRIYPERRKDLVVRKLLIEKKIYTDYELKRIKLRTAAINSLEQHRIKMNEMNELKIKMNELNNINK